VSTERNARKPGKRDFWIIGGPAGHATIRYRLPAIVEVEDAAVGELLTETQNVSARGVFLYLDRPLAEGSRMHVTLTLPPHITLTDPLRVRFTARVVRSEAPLPASRIGIAAVIEEYEFLRSASTGS
jgi:PilZ domain-containing protein